MMSIIISIFNSLKDERSEEEDVFKRPIFFEEENSEELTNLNEEYNQNLANNILMTEEDIL